MKLDALQVTIVLLHVWRLAVDAAGAVKLRDWIWCPGCTGPPSEPIGVKMVGT